MNKLISIEEAISNIKDGDVLMIGGFLSVGAPHNLIDALVAKGTKNLTLICNDSGFADSGVGKLVVGIGFKFILILLISNISLAKSYHEHFPSFEKL